MNREIKFRAQCAETKKWVYGLPCTETTLSNTITHISQFAGEQRLFGRHNVRIIQESVGQFTGLTDKNGVEIYEGDITNEGIVVFKNGCFLIILTNSFYHDLNGFKRRLYFTSKNQEVTGNIHQQ